MWSLSLDGIHVYRMSFSQPLCEVIDQPDDEWKLILAGTFTAMGLMTLGMYMWLVQSKRRTETFPGISIFQNKNKNEEMNLFYGKGKNSVPESRN
ncbi:uncharacterized protein LOC118194272 isoform X2 [Stegodyphus dumicola]|uniref:uncharacterized protein LOC118194272 isoform X2 n=1 Tax=Stegodyphus dumicola TaxID=202533 RepID=UPI0015B3218B|nr:uncharacterized protein LOC118194272 isoform X2 [Stegodyphus dumicola]